MGEADTLADLMAMPSQWVARIRQRRPMKKLILDMDNAVSETYGQQEGSMYNGHFACECYHPLFVSNGSPNRCGTCPAYGSGLCQPLPS